ncbi:MAG TPA: histidine kinase dimerization/phospho-acceptor domain-containing protein [Polyangiales bacterium]|nr:histidine kinase dimerization/phospho-acceptor domain-containing protein [Polyangiales bacterium]
METIWALGGSMFPFVPSNSLLYVTPPDRGSIRPGDIVCYPGVRHVIAHRVAGVEVGPQGRVFVTRGDAAGSDERVPENAVAYVVTRVEHGWFAYDADGWFGRFLASAALHRGVGFRTFSSSARLAVGLRARLREHCSAADSGPQPSAAGGTRGVARLSTTVMPPPRAASSSESPDSLLRLLNHELRTPLNGILGFIEVLLGELDGPLIVDERENLGHVRDAGRQLLGLVSEILDLVSAVASDREPMLEPVDLTDVLEVERASLEERRGVRPVYIRVDAAPDAMVVVDRAELRRVLDVFGELALSATQSGEVSLEAAAEGESVCVTVRAEGPLFPPPAKRGERPSTPAERDDRMRRLRLEIAKRLCERALGRFSLQTDSNRSEMKLSLPRDGTMEREPAARTDIPLAVRYLAATGHDLRTPLNAILGFSDLVGMHPHELWTEAQHRSLSIVRERARDLASMVDDMIDWAKLELGDLRLNQRQHDVHELIERAVGMAVERSGARGLRVEVGIDPRLDQLCVDADRFVQALLGLMDHSIRAAPAPVLSLSVVYVEAEGDQPSSARFEVTDPDLEIRDQDQAHIFAAFRPSFAPTGQRVAGLHLGTAVARAVIRAHGGDVWFERRPNQGTTFVASLPEACLA